MHLSFRLYYSAGLWIGWAVDRMDVEGSLDSFITRNSGFSMLSPVVLLLAACLCLW